MNNHKLTRREILRGALAASAGVTAFGAARPMQALAQATGGADLYYVFAYFSGGWDILLGLDPKDPVQFNAGNMSQTRIQPAYEQLQGTDGALVRTPSGTTFGPYIGDLANHHDKIAVIRGMNMETLTHEAGRRRFITGKPPSGLLARGSSVATHLASHFGQAQPIPNLSVRVESYNVDQPTYATALRAQGVSDLIRALRPSDPALDPRLDRQLDSLLSQFAECNAAKRSSVFQKAEEGRQQSREMTLSQLDRLFDFQANRPDMEAVRDHYGIGRSGTAALATGAAQAALAAQALKGGVSRSVSIQVASGLDTHFNDWATAQGPRQRDGFNAIARLIEDLETSEYKDTGTSWFDHTVILGFSEFSRTALLNTRGGRDHALRTACVVAGAGIQGGVVVGASSDRGMEPQPVDLATGAVDPGGTVPKPENVLRTLTDNAGLEDQSLNGPDLRGDPIPAIQRPIRT